MLHDFILSNSEQIVDRARMRGRDRAPGKSSEARLAHGIPLFLSQLADQLVPTASTNLLQIASSGDASHTRQEAPQREADRDGGAKASHDLLREVTGLAHVFEPASTSRSSARSGSGITGFQALPPRATATAGPNLRSSASACEAMSDCSTNSKMAAMMLVTWSLLASDSSSTPRCSASAKISLNDFGAHGRGTPSIIEAYSQPRSLHEPTALIAP